MFMYLKGKLLLASIILLIFTSILKAENEFPMDEGINYSKLEKGFT